MAPHYRAIPTYKFFIEITLIDILCLDHACFKKNLRNNLNFFPHNSKSFKLPDLIRLNNSYEIFHNKK